jgi:hypothetical protein
MGVSYLDGVYSRPKRGCSKFNVRGSVTELVNFMPRITLYVALVPSLNTIDTGLILIDNKTSS